MTKRNPAPAPSFFAPAPLPIPYAAAPYPAQPPPFSDELGKKPGTVPADLSVRVSVQVDRDATVATADLYEAGNPYAVPLACATGSAVRQREDAHDPETATLLAVSRALGKLSAKLNKKARGRIKSADSTRQDRARSKARKQERETGIPLAGLIRSQEPKPVVTVITGGATPDGTIIVNEPEGGLPAEMKDMVRSMFPARDIQFVPEADTVSVPERIEDFLNSNGAGGVHRERPEYKGRHVKPADGQGD